eukprot:c18720_g1_i1 orf=209-499(+)
MQRLQSMQWRVDVTFSTAHSHRLLRPSVLLRLELDDGSVRLVELDPERCNLSLKAIESSNMYFGMLTVRQCLGFPYSATARIVGAVKRREKLSTDF